MTYKINYDSQTTLILGKYPSTLYQNAPEPNIEISDVEYARIFGEGLFQRPCVVNEVIQEFQRPDSEILQEAKTSKLAQLDKNRNDFCLIPIEYQGNTYATTINAWTAISYLANGLSTLSTTADYPNYPAGDNITLTKADFKAIAILIQAREMSSRNLRKSKTDEINAISNDTQYFDENGEEITALEALEAINITFE